MEKVILEGLLEEEKLVAIIAAAIAAFSGMELSDFYIRSIKRFPSHTPIWSMIGRGEQVFSRLTSY